MSADLSGIAAPADGNLLPPPRKNRAAILGAGYVGTALAAHLVKRGWEVTALTRNAARAADLEGLGVATVVHDLADPGWHGRMAGDFDSAIVTVSSAGGGIAGYRHSYLRGLESVKAWATKRRLAALVYTSSTSVYDQTASAENAVPEVFENAAVGGDDAAQVLIEAEKLALSVSATRTAVLRLAGIYGPGRHQLLDRLRAGDATLPGSGEAHLNLIHRDDIVWAIDAVLKSDSARGIFNLADGNPGTKAEIAAWLAAQLVRPTPSFSGETDPRRRRPSRDRIIRSSRLGPDLGWSPRYPDFRAGYRAILAG